MLGQQLRECLIKAHAGAFVGNEERCGRRSERGFRR
jgi:hypothetical protein